MKKKLSVKGKENNNFEGRKNGKSTESWNSKNQDLKYLPKNNGKNWGT